jgi:hypothetical protein
MTPELVGLENTVGVSRVMSNVTRTIEELAREFSACGKTLDLRRAAFAIWTSFPDAPYTLDEIAEQLRHAAREHGADIFLDERRPGVDEVADRTPDISPFELAT